MNKATTSFRMNPSVVKKLKHMSVDHEMPIGDIIESLVKFYQSGKLIEDKEFQKRFNGLL